jgi:putative addiction module component (TIGR02574 family)
MAKNFRELEAKMSPKSRALSRALAKKYRAEMAQVTPQVSELLEKALALSSQDRGLLIDLLIATLDNEPAEEGVEAAWKEEIEHRIEDVRSGRVKMIPAEQVLARARARLRDAKAADIARWFAQLDEFRSEPFCENGIRPTPKK